MHPLLITAWAVAAVGVAILLSSAKRYRIGCAVLALAGVLFVVDDIRIAAPWWQFFVDGGLVGLLLTFVTGRSTVTVVREDEAAEAETE
jgi:hypothetical protein